VVAHQPLEQERERERHRLERELGRTPAGEQGLKRDHRDPGVTREQLNETLAVAVYMGGGPSLMYAAEALRAYEEFKG